MKGAPAPERSVWIDGQLRRGPGATLSIFDRGARDGEGLFETLRVHRGVPFQWERHIERLVLSAAELGFPVPPSPAELREALDQVLAAEGLADGVARITVTRGVPGGRPARCGAWVEAEPLAGRLWRGTVSGAASAIFSRRTFEPGPLSRHKTTSRLAYHLAREEARAARADEALLVDRAGEVLEGSVSNLFAVIDGIVTTPPLSAGILPGLTRSSVLTLCAGLAIPVLERAILRDELGAADEVFLSSSVQQVVPLARLDGRTVPRHEIGDRLLACFRAAVERELAEPGARGRR